MKPTKLILILLVMCSHYAYCQLYTNEVKVVNTGGNVGIGTSAPQGPLDLKLGNSESILTSGIPNGNFFIGSPNTNGVMTFGVKSGQYGWIQYTNRTDASLTYPLILNPNGGNVGIGTNSPTQKLVINGNVIIGPNSLGGGLRASSNFYIEDISANTSSQIWQNTNDANGPSLYFGKSRGTTYNANTIVQISDILGIIRFCGGDGGLDTPTEGASIRSEVDGSPANSKMPARLTFYTENSSGTYSEKMRIDKDGNVGIGITTPSYKLHVAGPIGATAFTQTSDLRLKNIFGIILGIEILKKYQSLNLYTYSFKKEENSENNKEHIGVVAQEVEKVFPEFVTMDKNGIKSVDYPSLAVTAIAAIKTQQEEIESMRKEIVLLRNQKSEKDEEFLNMINRLTGEMERIKSIYDHDVNPIQIIK